MPLRPFHYSFNGGEVSPRFDGRADHQRYQSSLQACQNFVISPVGGADRRPGTRMLARVKDDSRRVRLMPFEFNIEQAYVLEMGHQYIRFYRQGARLESPPGTPVEVASPYQESELFDLQTAQSADVMWIVHPSHAPRKLLRFSDTSWSLQLISFDPPPSAEEPTISFDIGLNLAATSGAIVSAIATGAIFLDGDVGRQITLVPSQGSQARATITKLDTPAPTPSVTLNILNAFPSASINAGTWRIDGPLGCGLHISDGTGLRGTPLKVTLVQRGITAPELLSNGSFAGGLTGWTDHSGAPLAVGVHTGGSGSNLQDTSKHFPALGVRVAMRAVNMTNGQSGTISAITPDGRSVATGTGVTFNNGDSYQIIGAGGAQPASSGGQLSGGNAGVGWIEQGIATVNGQTYQVQFDVEEGPISAQVGATSKGSELFHEASYPIGIDHELTFVAVSSGSYVQFRNNQPTMSRVRRVRAHNISALGYRPIDVGSFIKVKNGVLQILGLDNAHSANVIVRSRMDEPTLADVLAGAWSLEVPAWSASRGYPRAIGFHQQRLAFAGTAMQPLTIWQSETGNYEQFGASSLADSSLEQEFSANQMNIILWTEPFRDLLVGTARGEHLLRGVNGPLTPSNGEQLPQTTVGSQGLPPIRADNALILLLRGGRQIRELEYDQNGAVVRGKDHTLVAEHITAGGIQQWGFQSKPTAILWAVRGDGTLIGLTYEQFEQVQGWHRHTTDGTFESVCVVPVSSPSDAQTEAVYVATRRTITGQPRRFVEVLDPTLTLDCAMTYASVATQTLTGLGHLEGKTVAVIDTSNGADQPAVLVARVVMSGVISLEVPVTAAVVGLDYPTRLQPLRPELPMRDGTLQGRRKKWSKVTARALQTGGLLINGQEAIYRAPGDTMDEGLVLRDGDFEVVNLGWSRDGYLTITQADPLPCTLIALYGQLEVAED